MITTNDFQDKPINKTLNYIHWLFLTNIYFLLCNIIFILALYSFELSVSNIFIYFVALLPMGPSLTALCSCMSKILKDKYVDTTRDFFKAYKENFFSSMKIWLIVLITMFILIFDMKLCFVNNKLLFLLIPLIFLLILSISFCSYLFPLISKFQIKLLDVLKLSIYLSFKNLLTTIVNLIILIVYAYLFFYLKGITGFFLCSITCYGLMFNLKRTFVFVENKFLN